MSERVVLGQKAYILFYVLDEAAPPGTAALAAAMKQAAAKAAGGPAADGQQQPAPRRSMELQVPALVGPPLVAPLLVRCCCWS